MAARDIMTTVRMTLKGTKKCRRILYGYKMAVRDIRRQQHEIRDI